MESEELDAILTNLLRTGENEIVEFKNGFYSDEKIAKDTIGKYFSALSNEACLRGNRYAWLIFGIDDKTKKNNRYRFYLCSRWVERS